MLYQYPYRTPHVKSAKIYQLYLKNLVTISISTSTHNGSDLHREVVRSGDVVDKPSCRVGGDWPGSCHHSRKLVREVSVNRGQKGQLVIVLPLWDDATQLHCAAEGPLPRVGLHPARGGHNGEARCTVAAPGVKAGVVPQREPGWSPVPRFCLGPETFERKGPNPLAPVPCREGRVDERPVVR